MDYKTLTVGEKAPEVVTAIVETPKGSRNKYELDKESGAIKLDRVLRSSVGYPADYGLIPQTLYEDNDPLDVIIIGRFPLDPGVILDVRPIGVMEMIDGGEADDKIIAVPKGDIYYENWNDIGDVPEALKNEFREFFSTYKNLEKKKTEVKEFKGRDRAHDIIKKSVINS